VMHTVWLGHGRPWWLDRLDPIGSRALLAQPPQH
jgi:hypothetical protein